MRLLPAIAYRFTADLAGLVEQLDRFARNVNERIAQLQLIPIVGGKFFEGIELPDATNVPVRHGLGRLARVFMSVPYAKTGSPATGHVRDRTRVLASQYDPTQFVVLRADDWTTTMFVDLWVF